jgi:hypothetical protein
MEQLEKYIADLLRHDWFYEYSDDHSVWRAGKSERSRLIALADTGKSFKMAYDAVARYMNEDHKTRDFGKLDRELNEARALEKS